MLNRDERKKEKGKIEAPQKPIKTYQNIFYIRKTVVKIFTSSTY